MQCKQDSKFKIKFKFKNNLLSSQPIKEYSKFFHSGLENIIKPFNYSFIPILSFGIWLLTLPGCSDDKIIKQDKLVLIYTDLLIVQDTVVLDDKGVDSLRQSVFKKYNVTEKDYQNTIDYYNEDLERWEEFFDKVTAHIEKRSLSPPSPREKAF